jgi:hypothetical protein
MGLSRILMSEHFAALFAVVRESRFVSTLLGKFKARVSLYNADAHNEDVVVRLNQCFKGGAAFALFCSHPACGPQWGLLMPILVALRVNLEFMSAVWRTLSLSPSAPKELCHQRPFRVAE